MQFSIRHGLYAGALLLTLAVLAAGYYLWTNNGESAPQNPAQKDSKPEFPARFDRLGVRIGDASAPVVVREFIDYQCPACKRFAPIMKTLIRETDHVAQGRVQVVIFDFPLAMHDNALPAAQAARCAARQDAFLPMHDALFARQDQWSEQEDPVPVFRTLASENGLDGDKLVQCIREERTLKAVQQSRELSRQLGIRSTPTVLINDHAYSGEPDYPTFRASLNEALTRQAE